MMYTSHELYFFFINGINYSQRNEYWACPTNIFITTVFLLNVDNMYSHVSEIMCATEIMYPQFYVLYFIEI